MYQGGSTSAKWATVYRHFGATVLYIITYVFADAYPLITHTLEAGAVTEEYC
jgi:hypothetical protein